MGISRIICRLFGHSWFEDPDCWHHAICGRCGMGIDDPDARDGWFEPRAWRLGHWHFVVVDPRSFGWRRWMLRRCIDCKRPEIVAGRHVGNHDDCDQVPF